jgi:hypothetical protein
VRAGILFDVPFEHRKHACLHNPDGQGVEPIEDEAFEPSGPEGLVSTDYEPRPAAGPLLQQKTPQPFDIGRRAWLPWIEVAPAP